MATKKCIRCGKEFTRNRSYSRKRWEDAKYCSRQCFGYIVKQLQLNRFKDETVHPRWKGNDVGYWGVHDWISKHYGQPLKCEVCGLDDKNRKYHWANLSYKYKRDISDWKRMCVSCHRKYDYSNTRNNK